VTYSVSVNNASGTGTPAQSCGNAAETIIGAGNVASLTEKHQVV
jgi:hypothetical protein